MRYIIPILLSFIICVPVNTVFADDFISIKSLDLKIKKRLVKPFLLKNQQVFVAPEKGVFLKKLDYFAIYKFVTDFEKECKARIQSRDELCKGDLDDARDSCEEDLAFQKGEVKRLTRELGEAKADITKNNALNDRSIQNYRIALGISGAIILSFAGYFVIAM